MQALSDSSGGFSVYAVVGRQGVGKSLLANALLGVDDDGERGGGKGWESVPSSAAAGGPADPRTASDPFPVRGPSWPACKHRTSGVDVRVRQSSLKRWREVVLAI